MKIQEIQVVQVINYQNKIITSGIGDPHINVVLEVKKKKKKIFGLFTFFVHQQIQ